MEYLKIFLDHLIPIFATFLVAFLTPLLKKLMDHLLLKYHLTNLAIYEDRVTGLVQQGIEAVERRSLGALKAGQPATPGGQKLQQVMEFVDKTLADHDLPKKTGEQLAVLVDSQLSLAKKEQSPAPAQINLPSLSSLK